jgi:hypothetical protein
VTQADLGCDFDFLRHVDVADDAAAGTTEGVA